MRTAAIWIFGLLAALIVGALIGSQLDSNYGSDKGFFGAIAGMLAFACFRLWFGGRAPKS